MADGDDLPTHVIRLPEIHMNLHSHLQSGTNSPNPRRFQEGVHRMIRQLRPFVEADTPNGRRLDWAAWIRHQASMRRVRNGNPFPPLSSNRDGNAGNGEEFVVDLETGQAREPRLSPEVQAEGETMPPTNGNSSTNGNNNGEAMNAIRETLRQNPELRNFLQLLERFIPFVLILMLKCLYDRITGILIFLGLLITFSHSNAVVKREVAKQSKRNILSLLPIVVNLATCTFFIYYVFSDQKLYLNLILLPSFHAPVTFWDLMWVVGITDYVLKMMTILLKIGILAFPISFLPIQRRGKYYLFIEQSSQLYRSFLPIHAWIHYLIFSFQGVGRVFGYILGGIYVLAKIKDIFAHVKAWRVALVRVMQNVTYGTVPNKEQIEATGNQCAICQDDLHSPTLLHCSHIFCEECVATWFDRERTCPMCRAQVADDPQWRDGSTTFFLQIF